MDSGGWQSSSDDQKADYHQVNLMHMGIEPLIKRRLWVLGVPICEAAQEDVQKAFGRDVTLDWIKAVCILLMVYGHTVRLGSTTNIQNQIVAMIYQFHVPVFVMVSGFLTGWRAGGLRAFLKVINRVWRPYFLFAPFFLVLLMWAKRIGIGTSSQSPDSFVQICISLLKGRGVGALWFLYALGLAQILLLLANYVARKLDASRSVTLCIVLAIFAVAVQLGTALRPDFVFFFLLGMTFKAVYHELPKAWLGFPLAAGCFLLIGKFGVENDFLRVTLVLSVIMALGKAAVYFKSSMFIRSGSWLGQRTMPILVFHSMLNIVIRPLSSVLLSVDQSGILWPIFNVVITVGLCLFVDMLMRRTGSHSFAFGK